MKIKLFLATLALASSFSVFADSYGIYCLSRSCDVMTNEQLSKIDHVIDEQLRENINDKSFSGTTKSVVILNRESVASHISIVPMTKEETRDYLGLSKATKPDIIDMDESDTFMSFKISPLKDRTTYFAANVYLERNPLRADPRDPDAYYVTMNTIGFGKQIRNGWTVEIGLVKNINERSGAALKFNPAPDGFMLTFKKQL